VKDSGWSTVVTHSDRLSAEASVAVLRANDVPTLLTTDETLPASGTIAVRVPTELLHRARWVLNPSEVSDRELEYLATHELSDDSSQPQ
jgi:hypothetical protein